MAAPAPTGTLILGAKTLLNLGTSDVAEREFTTFSIYFGLTANQTASWTAPTDCFLWGWISNATQVGIAINTPVTQHNEPPASVQVIVAENVWYTQSAAVGTGQLYSNLRHPIPKDSILYVKCGATQTVLTVFIGQYKD